MLQPRNTGVEEEEDGICIVGVDQRERTQRRRNLVSVVRDAPYAVGHLSKCLQRPIIVSHDTCDPPIKTATCYRRHPSARGIRLTPQPRPVRRPEIWRNNFFPSKRADNLVRVLIEERIHELHRGVILYFFSPAKSNLARGVGRGIKEGERCDTSSRRSNATFSFSSTWGLLSDLVGKSLYRDAGHNAVVESEKLAAGGDWKKGDIVGRSHGVRWVRRLLPSRNSKKPGIRSGNRWGSLSEPKIYVRIECVIV